MQILDMSTPWIGAVWVRNTSLEVDFTIATRDSSEPATGPLHLDPLSSLRPFYEGGLAWT